MACLFTNKIVFFLAFSRRSGADQCVMRTLRIRCVLLKFKIRCIRSKYAARRLVMRYAYGFHTLKHPGGLWRMTTFANV